MTRKMTVCFTNGDRKICTFGEETEGMGIKRGNSCI